MRGGWDTAALLLPCPLNWYGHKEVEVAALAVFTAANGAEYSDVHEAAGYGPNAAEHVQAAIDSKMYRSTRGYFSHQSSLSFMILYSEKYSSISHSRETVAGDEDGSRSEACWRAHSA